MWTWFINNPLRSLHFQWL